MLRRGAAVLLCLGLFACNKKDAAPTTVEPTAAPAPVTPAEPEESEDLDDFDDEEAPADEAPPPMAEEPSEVTFKLHNLCNKSMQYVLAPLRQGEVDVENPKTIKAGGVEEVTAPYGIGVHLVNLPNAAAAATEVNGGHVWVSSSCSGVGSSDDPKADPAKIDKELRDKIKRMTEAAKPKEAKAKADDAGE